MSKEKQPKDPAEQGKEIKTAADLKQDSHNYRKHSDTNKARIKKSIDEAGLGRSVVIDADGVLVAGNGVQQVIDKDTPVRVVETDGTELVVVKRTDLHTDDPRRKTLALADNATADDVEWDFEAIEADGWTEDEAGDWGVAFYGKDNPYSSKIETPIYEPKMSAAPSISELVDTTKAEQLIEGLDGIEDEQLRKFLTLAAYRHVVFDYSLIAEYYAHADAETKEKFEQSALVIIDFDKAIENGFVEMSTRLLNLVGDEDDDEA